MSRVRAWRTPLFWIATGAFVLVFGNGLFYFTLLAASKTLLRWRGGDAGNVMWSLVLGIPLAFFAVLFSDVRGRVRAALAWIDAPVSRAAFLVLACSVVALERAAQRAGVDFGADTSGWIADAGSLLTFVAPIAFGALLVGVRRGGGESAVSSPMLWLAAGMLVAIVGMQLGHFAWVAAMFVAAHAHVGRAGVTILTWVVTVAAPLVCLGLSSAALARRSPDGLVRTRPFAKAVGTLVAAGVGAFLIVDPLWDSMHAALPVPVWAAADLARALAVVVAGCVTPLVAGSVMLALRSEAERQDEPASASSAAPSRCT